MINRIKGTQDLLDLTLFNFLIESVKKQLALYNFHEIATPIIEPTDLFKRSLGTETDVVNKEMYTVNTGADQELICLRPEATAATMRAFIEAGIQTIPWKVFSWGPMFRHERPQKGRYRQFHQVSLEVIGSDSIYQDIQVITLLERLFCDILKLDEYALHINFLGCAQDRIVFKKLLYDYLTTLTQLCDTCIIRKEKNILRVFDCKVKTCQELYADAPKITQSLCATCLSEWQTIKQSLEHLSVSYSHVPTLVRGLDYYEKTVFEFVGLQLGAQNAFCGGGRYNQLATIVGSKQDYPSVGAALGIDRLVLLLEQKKDGLLIPQKPPLYIIAPFSKEQFDIALLLADELQAQNICVDVLLEGASFKSMLRHANKAGARACLIIGPDEQKAREVTVKNMITGAEEKVSQRDVAIFLKA
jgi:histidyl-tRNA synthetase